VAGWLPWIADGVNLLFTAAAVFWSLAMIIAPRSVDPPLVELSMLPLTLFTFKATKMIYLYRTRMAAGLVQTLAAGLAGLSLSHTIAKAVLKSFFTSNLPFFRTPKLVGRPALVQAVSAAGQEWLMLILLAGSAVGIGLRSNMVMLDLHVWLVVLFILATPYLASVLVSLISGFAGLPHTIMRTPSEKGLT
jgi:hypothetical protein